MADEQTENTDPSNPKDVAKRLGQSIFEGFKNISSGVGKSLPGKDMIREMGRTMLTGGIAAAGSNAAINSGDPTYAITGQRMAQAVDKTIQQHWWIQKAKDFEKEKLKPLRSQMEQLKRDYDAKSNELQARMYDHDNKFSAEKEAQLEAALTDARAQFDAGQMDEDELKLREQELSGQITELQNARNADRDILMSEYSATVSSFNNMYTQQIVQLMNEAAMYDQNNPILGQMVNGLTGIAQQEMESLTSKLAVGNEASKAMDANEAAYFESSSRPTITQQKRKHEAATVEMEATARTSTAMATDAENELDRPKPPPEEATGLDRLSQLVQEKIRTSRSPGQAIKQSITDGRVMQETQNVYNDDVQKFERALGYVVEDEDGNLAPNEDLITDEEDLASLRAEMAQFSLSYEAAKSIQGNENMSVSELSDYMDELNIKDPGLKIPTATTIIQQRLAKSGKRVTAKAVREALDQAQANNPATVEEMISGAVHILGGNEKKETKEKGLFDSAKTVISEGAKKVTSLFSGEQETQPQQTSKPAADKNKKITSLLKDTPGGDTDKRRELLSNTQSDTRPRAISSSSITPRKLMAKVSEKDHGKVYGALVLRRAKLQALWQEYKGDPDLVSESKSIERELESLEAFINAYRTDFKDNKLVKDEMDQIVRSGKLNDKLLAKYGL